VTQRVTCLINLVQIKVELPRSRGDFVNAAEYISAGLIPEIYSNTNTESGQVLFVMVLSASVIALTSSALI
jgi:hypothetical protein